ncbi:MAG: topoisomerase DNA-binding C4 zinc finger domain-containing protein [Sedimentibacter sp.]|nr:topoisomerase DNA-binding C4 zinc finger domain-containing protein [Sedimentibacter sp.]
MAQIGKCPRCGGKLVERNGKYGTFFGCTNYPKCMYTLKKSK